MIIQYIKNLTLVRFLRSWFTYHKYIKKNFLKIFHRKKLKKTKNTGLKVFIPMIETKHYQYFQVLAIAKALELRGAQVLILLCDSSLNGCEIKSVKSKNNPCLECNFSKKNIFPHMDFDTVNISDYIQNERFNIDKLSVKIFNDSPGEFFYKGVEIMKMVGESILRYYYGKVPDLPNNQLAKVTESHINTSIVNIEVATFVVEHWKPDIFLGNMLVYSSWNPYYQVAKNNNILKMSNL